MRTEVFIVNAPKDWPFSVGDTFQHDGIHYRVTSKGKYVQRAVALLPEVPEFIDYNAVANQEKVANWLEEGNKAHAEAVRVIEEMYRDGVVSKGSIPVASQ